MANDDKPRWIKIGFQQSVEDLFQRGPTVSFGVASTPYIKGQPITEVLGQIDTGAGATGLSPKLVAALKLKPCGDATAHEAGREPLPVRLYEVRIFTPDMNFEVTAAGLPSLAPPHDILIGRDILGRFRLVVDFTTGVTALHYKEP